MVDAAREKVGLVEVARKAGVSKSTASKAINGRPDVSEDVRRRVMRAASHLGYRRPRAAGPGFIAFVADSLTATYTLEVMRGIVKAGMRAGIGILTYYTPDDGVVEGVPPLEVEWFEEMAAGGCIGVIAVTSTVGQDQAARAARLALPLVVVDPANAISPEVVCISATNWNGGVEATTHLLTLGHRRIAFLRGPHGSLPSDERMQGYLSALQMVGIEVDEGLIVGESFMHDGGLAAADELLSRPEGQRPTAIFAATDVTALAAMEAARRRGLRVPGDVSIVGFDDTFLAGLATPQLTTVRQPLEEMGSTAVRQIIALSNGEPSLKGTVRLPTELVVRGSTQGV